MYRLPILVMSMLAVAACMDNRPHDGTSSNSGSMPVNRLNASASDGSSDDGRAQAPGNANGSTTDRMLRTSPVSDPVLNDGRWTGAPSMERTAALASPADRGGKKNSTLTAGDQSESESDRLITQSIRQALVADPVLSVMAKNATIITVRGIVTLRGSVDTAAERQLIGSKAEGIPGVRRVDNIIEVKR